MRNKKWIAAALVCGFVLGNSMPAAQAGILDKVLKGGVIGYAVDATAPALNNAINSVTAKYGVSSTDATKVVPVISVGDGSRAGVLQTVSVPFDLAGDSFALSGHADLRGQVATVGPDDVGQLGVDGGG